MQPNTSGEVGFPNMTKVTFRDCKICGYAAKSGHGLSLHLRMKHSVGLLEYAETYEGYERPRCTVCGNPARYKGEGLKKPNRGFCFYATCSDECRAIAIGSKHKGRPRPASVKAKEAKTQRNRWRTMTPERREEVLRHVAQGTADAARTGGSSIELAVESLLLSLGIPFEKQKAVGRYIADFFLPNVGIYMEVDGCYWHGCAECGYARKVRQDRVATDKRKDAYFRHHRLTLVRIPEHDIRDHLDQVRASLQQWTIAREGVTPPVETEREAPTRVG